MKILVSTTLCFSLLLTVACAGESPVVAPVATPRPSPDLGATVQAAVSAALPDPTPTPTPDLDATVEARMAATITTLPSPTLQPTYTPVPTPTRNIAATASAWMATAVASVPTATPTPTAMPTATPTPTPVPTATPKPTPSPRLTLTPTPRPTATPNPAILLSEMVRQARPAVVRIETRTGSGSGVIFETQGQTAYIVTNNHVVESFGQVNVVVNDSATYRGTVRGTDHVRDLAVVSICCGSFRALPFGDASRLEPGDEVIAIGYALGIQGEATITRGIISAIRYDSEYQSDVIQTDAAVNPGNSGGPMLSMSGKVLGINTFGADKSMSEGLNFAISATTVQQRIPMLKIVQAAPTPTPTRKPTPTPAPWTTSGFGPISGELWHDPSDGLIKIEYANVSLTDMFVGATFINPYPAYSNSWDYGFLIRSSGSGSSARFIEVVVTSRGQWEAAWRYGGSSESEEIASGTLGYFDTSAGGRNTLLVIAFGERGLFFVNGDMISMLDLSEVTGAGDVAVITGAYTGNEVAGAVTLFEDFEGGRFTRQYGPASGRLEHKQGIISGHSSGVWTQDLVAEAEFTNPPGRDWDYGFVIRNPEFNRLEVIGLTGNRRWFHDTSNTRDDEYITVADGFLPVANFHSRNHLLLFAAGDIGTFVVNGQLVAWLDLSHNQDWGGVSVMGGFFNDHTGEPTFDNFSVWTE